MESGGEDLDEIFGEYDNEREADNPENVQETGTNETSGVKVPVPKRTVRNPRLKFNAERLCGDRGIPVLMDHFKNVKFKGPGHEKEDLDKLLTKLEHWTHRLFPSMKFKDCLQHIEKLGKKRPVQTCLRKIRLNMPILSSDFVHDDEDNVQRVEDSEPAEVDPFDRLIGESQDSINPSISAVEDISERVAQHSFPLENTFGPGRVLGSSPSSSASSLTEEQKERIERNRMLAAERRKARLAALQHNSSEIQSTNEKVIPSQDISKSHENSSSSSRNQANESSTANDLFTKFCRDNDISMEESPSELNNQNSENLGLDDLIDLVDDEEPVPDKKFSALSSEKGLSNQNSKNLELHDVVDLVDDEESVSDKNTAALSSEKGISKLCNQNSKDLGLDNLVDLVDGEESFSNKNTVALPSVVGTSELNDQNSENLCLEDLVDLVEEEPVPDKNTATLSSEKCKTVCGGKNKNVEISCDSVQAHSPSFDQNINDNVTSDNTDFEVIMPDKITKNDNLEMESLLDLVDEASGDNEPSSDPSCSVMDSSVINAKAQNMLLNSEEEPSAMEVCD